MEQQRLNVTLTLAAPILTRSSSAGLIGVDAPVARRNGRCYLPFSLVKGRIRQSWDELRLPGSDIWFGTREGTWSPSRGRFRFGDFIAATGDVPRDFRGRHRIRIEPETGAAREGALQVIESPFGAGEHVVFDGVVTWFSTAEEAKNIAEMVKAAFRWTPSFGSGRTIGFGRVINVECALAPPEPAVKTSRDGTAIYAMSLHLSDPICLARKRIDENLFASDNVISGAVIRGVAASTLNQLLGRGAVEEIRRGIADGTPWRELADHFNDIRLTHSFPSTSDRSSRPTVPPLSIVRDGGGKWWDVATCDGPGLIGGAAPSFAVDWKEPAPRELRDEFGWPHFKTEIRVRTAIERGSKRAADAQLFAYEMIDPAGIVWLGRADFSAIDASVRGKVAEQFENLFAIEPAAFGKTKARGRITLSASPSSEVVLGSGTHIVTLQTPALLCNPETLDESSGRDALFAAYAAAFHSLGGNHVRLLRFFASQSLAGGYLLHRYQSGKPYSPFLLTDAGSVFVIECDDEGARRLSEWRDRGIPLPSWAVEAYGDSWKENPFLPEDGYGEIMVDHDCHARVPAGFQCVAKWSPPDVTLSEEREDRQARRTAVRPVTTLREEMAEGLPSVWPFTNRWQVTGRLTTASDFHLGSGEGTTRGDLAVTENEAVTPVAINAVSVDAAGRAYIPGSSLKGALRSWLSQRADQDSVAAIFGDDRENTAHAGTVEFHDAFVSGTVDGDFSLVPHWDADRRTGVTVSVALDRSTRTASDKKLFHSEYVPPGISFDVVITGQDLTNDQVALLLGCLRAFSAEQNAMALGSETREGWGRFRWGDEAVRTFTDTSRWTGNWNDIAALQTLDLDALVPPVVPRVDRELRIPLEVTFDSAFLVNEPSRTRAATSNERDPNHAPRVDCSGAVVLPVSAFRGALRAQAERIARTVDVRACKAGDVKSSCAAVHEPGEAKGLCVTCRLFGATGWASPISFSRFRLTNEPPPYHQELVAIDRFTGGVAGSAKFDLEAVWRPSFSGALTIDRERIDDEALGLLVLALHDLTEGDISLGFGASKGFGSSRASYTPPQDFDLPGCVAAFRRNLQPSTAAPFEPNAELPLALQEQPPAQTTNDRDAFHNPYAFVPVTKVREGDLPIDALRTNRAGGVTHDRYTPGTFSGRIICRLETETETIIGARQDEDAGPQGPKRVHPFLDPDATDRAAIPSTTLRGLISSVAETASNSALRVLNDASLSFRCSETETLRAIGMISGSGKELRPLALSQVAKDGQRYRNMFNGAPPTKVYVDGYQTTKTKGTEIATLVPDSFLADHDPDSYSPDHREFWYMRQRRGASSAPINQKSFDALEDKSGYTRGILRVLGVEDRPSLSRRKHEIFIPMPPGSEGRSLDATSAIAEFERLARERTDADPTLPFEVKGSRRNSNPQHDRYMKLRDGDIVFFEPAADGRSVARLAISAIWRKAVDASVHGFFAAVSPDLLPMNSRRTNITPAEQLFGYVSIDESSSSDRSIALAGRVRFSMARRDATNAEVGDFLDECILQPLLSPKPPSPAFYFRPRHGTGPIAKRDLNRNTHVPQGRKVYLHRGSQPGNWRREGAGDHFSNRVRPIRARRVFWFHVDVDNLSASELGLLLYSLRPTEAFRHKMGMGKALGLGSVRIDPVAVLRVNRVERYRKDALVSNRYDGAWFDSRIAPDSWPVTYSGEAAAAHAVAQLENLFERFRHAYRTRMEPDIRVPLELIGDPSKIVAKVHTPQTADREIGVESYHWFMGNERSRQPQWLEPLDRTSTALPLLSRSDRRIQHSKGDIAPQAREVARPAVPPPAPQFETWDAVLVHQPNVGKIKAVVQRDGGSKLEAWASKGLPGYDDVVMRIKKKGELKARVEVEKALDGSFAIKRIHMA